MLTLQSIYSHPCQSSFARHHSSQDPNANKTTWATSVLVNRY